jgi:pimeloyl-ACP methyl ester carboxylesterase
MKAWMKYALLSVCGIAASIAALSACATQEIPYAELKARYGLPSSRTFEPEPGLIVHYTDEGAREGRTLVLVHGFAASVHAWRPWVERLDEEFRVIAIDLPGHGLTEAPPNYQASMDRNAELVGKLADHAGARRFVLAGNSMGGGVSLAYAMEHPERLEALVLVDAAGWPGEEGEARGGPPGFFGLLNNPVGRFFLKLFDVKMFAVDGLKSAYLDETLVTDEVINRYADLAMGVGHRDILLTQNSRPGEPWTPADFKAIRVPTLVISGEQDKLIPVEDARAIAAAIPGAALVTYPEGGHLPMEQLPHETVRDLRAFLARIGVTAESAAPQ